MEPIKGNPYSYLTAKERDKISFPARILRQHKLLAGKVLDLGCGNGKDVSVLINEGIDITGYDPYYAPVFPDQKFDTIICIYVLNVLLPEEQAEVLMDVSHLLKAGGKAYFAVRRDLQYEGFRTHKVHKKPTYQCNILLPYRSIYRNESCEIYEYQHYTSLHKGNSSISPFFELDESRVLIVETATAFSIFDKYPVSPGHALVIPKRAVQSYFDLTWKEQMACWILVNRIKKILDAIYNPAGFNIGINVLKPAGQTVDHVHIHLIPRYTGDVQDARGGVRGVIPDKKNY